LFQKLLKDLKELAEYDQFTSTDRPIFLNNNEDHPVQNRESLENSSEENVESPQDSDIHQLIEECSIEVPEQQKQNMEKMMLDLVKICHHKQFLCIHDDISVYDDDFEDIEYVEALLLDLEIVSIEEENGVEEENVVHREEEDVDLEDISQVQDVVLQTRSGNTTHANYSLPEYDLFCFEIEPDQERLINLVENDIPDDSSNDPLLEEIDLFLSDNSIPPGIENFADDPKGDIRFLEELLIDDSILFYESSDFEDSPSISRPPPEMPDNNFDLEPEVISVVMEDIDEPDEHFNPGGEINVSKKIEDDDYFPFTFVILIFLPYLILLENSSLLLSAESKDTIFDPGLSFGD
nr:hypothetical protein [Tanacetum cinerariifolium]